MNKNIIIILAILILPMCFYYYLDKSQAVSATKSTADKPTIIKFSSDMCSECKKMDVVFNKVYPTYSNKIVLINVPVQKQTKDIKNLIREYNVTLVPTLIFKKSDGQISKRVEGSMNETAFENCLKGLLDE